jgi:predicted nucleic acid-binding protein
MGRLILPHRARVYLDANIIIHLVEGNPVHEAALSHLLRMIESGAISTVSSELSLAEALVKPYSERNQALAGIYERLFAKGKQLEVIPIDRTILREAARYRVELGIKLPDAIHLATAMTSQCRVLMTEDTRFRMPRSIELARLSDLSS